MRVFTLFLLLMLLVGCSGGTPKTSSTSTSTDAPEDTSTNSPEDTSTKPPEDTSTKPPKETGVKKPPKQITPQVPPLDRTKVEAAIKQYVKTNLNYTNIELTEITGPYKLPTIKEKHKLDNLQGYYVSFSGKVGRFNRNDINWFFVAGGQGSDVSIATHFEPDNIRFELGSAWVKKNPPPE